MGEHSADVELMMAGSVITVFPILLVFAIAQNYYIQGIMGGALKE
jgi:multiple sugar transport system permease protein